MNYVEWTPEPMLIGGSIRAAFNANLYNNEFINNFAKCIEKNIKLNLSDNDNLQVTVNTDPLQISVLINSNDYKKSFDSDPLQKTYHFGDMLRNFILEKYSMQIQKILKPELYKKFYEDECIGHYLVNTFVFFSDSIFSHKLFHCNIQNENGESGLPTYTTSSTTDFSQNTKLVIML